MANHSREKSLGIMHTELKMLISITLYFFAPLSFSKGMMSGGLKGLHNRASVQLGSARNENCRCS